VIAGAAPRGHIHAHDIKESGVSMLACGVANSVHTYGLLRPAPGS